MTARLAALLAALACAVPVAAHALDPSRAPSQYVHAAWSSESGLPQNTVYQMAETPDGLLWLATEEGLVAFDGARFEVHDKLRHPELETSAVRALSVAPDGALYAGTRVGQVCRFEHGHLTRCWGRAEGVDVGIFEAVLALDDGRVLAGGPEGLIAIAGDTARRVADVGVAALVRDERGALVATREGLARWDGARLSPLAGAPRGPVSALAREAGGTLWAAIDGVVHVEEDGALRPFFPEVLTEVRAVLRDRDGVVWIAARDGLHRVYEGAHVLTHHAVRVLSLYEPADGALWFGTAFEGLHRLSDGVVDPYGEAEGLALGPVLSVLAARDGTLWIGVAPHGLVRARIDDGGATELARYGADTGLPDAPTYAMAEASDGRLWAGTSAGLFVLEGGHARAIASVLGFVHELALDAEGHVLVAHEDGLLVLGSGGELLRTLGEADGLPEREAMLVRVDRAGRVWVGTTSSLARLPSALAPAAELERVPSPVAASVLLEEPDGTVWIGSRHAGLHRLRDGELRGLTRASGLPDDTFYTLFDDGLGHLVSSSNRGLAVIDRASLDDALDRRGRVRAVLLDERDGMRVAECNGPAGARDEGGALWFPTVRGLVSLSPSRLPRSWEAPRVTLLRAHVDERELLPTPSALELPADAERFAVELGVRPLPEARPPRLRSRLRGLDDAWVDVGTERVVRAYRPPPGEYVLEVAAEGRDGVWGPTRAVPIRVAARWYESRWTALVAALALIALGALAARARIVSLRRRQTELEATVRARTRELAQQNEELAGALARVARLRADLVRAERMAATATIVRGVAHELNNPIGFVHGNLPVLRRYVDFLLRAVRALRERSTLAADELERALRFSPTKDLEYVAEDLRRLLDDVAEGARRARLTVADLERMTAGRDERVLEEVAVRRAAEQSARLLASRAPEGASVSFEIDEGLRVVARAGQLEQALGNVIDNALRAIGPGGRVVVRAEDRGERVVIEIEDDGAGMSEETRARAMEPFFTTRAAGEGSGMGLAIVSAIVSAHGGSLAIESRAGRGTTVRITLPRQRG